MWPCKQILLKRNAMEQSPAETGDTALISQKEKILSPSVASEELRSGKSLLSYHNLSLIILGLARSSSNYFKLF